MNDFSPCPDQVIVELAQQADEDTVGSLSRLGELLKEFPGDSRLYFLQGSLLAAERRYDEARQAMARAILISPDYSIARFQLGLLEFTSGDNGSAFQTWAPLRTLPQDNPLRLFVAGLEALAQDNFTAAIELLTSGISCNAENLPLNADMTMLVSKIQALNQEASPLDAGLSSEHLLLQQYGSRFTIQ